MSFGEIVKNFYKLSSGLILFIIGIIIEYETIIYKLLDVLLILGFIITIMGIILMISYFVDISALKTRNLVRDIIKNDSRESFMKWKNNFSQDKNSTGPLIIRKEFDNYDEDFFDNSQDDPYFTNTDPVLRVSNDNFQNKINSENQLNFTPNYDKPLKVTRTPRKRNEPSSEEVDYSYLNNNIDKSEEIEKALKEDNSSSDESDSFVKPRDIKIDVNNPESLPIPKFLDSFVLSDNQLITSKNAFEQLSVYIKKEMMLEIPNLNGLSDRFLSHIPTNYSRLIIEEFDVSDIAYIILISSLLKQGVHIKTIPNVNTINFIADDSNAMIISDNTLDDIEYGAVYNDRKAISQIRASFEKIWEIAEDLNMDIILKYMNEGV